MKHINYRISLIDSILVEDKKKYHISKETFNKPDDKQGKGSLKERLRSKEEQRMSSEHKEYEEKKANREGKYPFTRYKNYSRKSGVYAYGISPDKTDIHILFTSGAIYKYDTKSTPSFRIAEMIKRAKSGWGLNRYLNWKRPGYYYKGRWK